MCRSYNNARVLSTVIAALILSQNPAIRPAVPIDPSLSQPLVEKVSSLFGQALQDHGVKAPEAPTDGAIEQLRLARVSSAELNFKKAIEQVEVGIAQQKQHPERVADVKDLISLHMVKVVALLALKQPKALPPVWREIRTLSPSYSPSIDDFSPAVLSAFETWKAKEPAPAATRVTISSVPPLAEVLVDGVSRGVAPVVLTDLAPGSHLLRTRLADNLDNAQWVNVVAGDQSFSVSLEPDVLRTTGATFDAALRTASSETAAAAKAWAAALGTEGFSLALLKDGNALLASAARVQPDGTSTRRVIRLQDSLADAPAQLTALVNALFEGGETALVNLKETALVDFKASWSGLRPPAPVAVVQPPIGPAPVEPPLYKKPVFWVLVGVGAAVVGGSVATIAITQRKTGLGVTVELPQ